ncbi:MAG: sugar phosphate isomerase/epimerase [Acidobacteria bacterium]|nr:sugar phosphate isomerase/epimerase [Acidobacteriota bacterium]
MPNLTRRDVLIAATATGGVLASQSAQAAARSGDGKKPTLCLFSKPLPFLGYSELGKALGEMGIPGVDLTTRPSGHVLPENVERDLPKAQADLKKHGVEISMITTGLTSIDDPAARPTLHTAARLGVPFFKLGYYRYEDLSQLDSTLAEVKREVEGLAGLAQQAGIQGGFHNHSGAYVGAAMWDHWWALRDTDPRWMGFYFDPMHATVEGGGAGWKIGFQRLASRLKMVSVKDFFWEKRAGKWTHDVCPLGEGMVDLPAFFRTLAATDFDGPITLHVEYEIQGATESARRDNVLAAIEKDYKYLKKIYNEAYGA